MSFLDLVRIRQSDRAFDADKPVEKEKLERILEAAQLAPSACNAQPWKFIIVDDRDLRYKIADATSNRLLSINHFTKQAPVHLIIVEEKANVSSSFGSFFKKKHFPHIDIGIVAEHICLAAADEGLGSCMIGWFDEKKIKSLLNIPSSRSVVLDIVIGYSTQPLRNKKRKNLSDIVSFNTYK
ncbi:MAG: nitroreductase family protein [Bacteroidales bacterium]